MKAEEIIATMEKMIISFPHYIEQHKLAFTMNSSDVVVLSQYFGTDNPSVFSQVKFKGIEILYNSKVKSGEIYLGFKL
jgi:hypothetical protein